MRGIYLLITISAATLWTGCGPALETGFVDSWNKLPWYGRVLLKPKLQFERPVCYQGEDIWVLISIPSILPSFYSSDTSNTVADLLGSTRVFRDTTELTEPLFRYRGDTPPGPIEHYSSPGGPYRRRINSQFYLAPNNYWGVFDVGVISRRAELSILPLPDSLSIFWDYFVKIRGLPKSASASYSRFRLPPSADDDTHRYARLLLTLPLGAPLRMEGLRICASRCYLYQDSTLGLDDRELWYQVVEQYLKEPRAEPNEAVCAILNLNRWSWYDKEVLELAELWGGIRMGDAVNHHRSRF